MKIIVVDGYTLNPGDLSWKELEKLGEVVIHDRTAEHQLPERCRDADVILTNKAPISEKLIALIPGLKLISVTATGYNIVDIEAARKRNIPVCNVPAYGTASVAQHTIALILELANRVGMNSASVRKGDWQRSDDFCYTRGSLTELHGKTMGIVGFGKIGQQVCRIATALGMKVIYNSRTKKETSEATYVDLETLCKSSDVVSLHCPLTKSNNQFINRGLLNLMKPTAWLVNTSRGQLINEADLAAALNNSQLAGAALDVLSVEPPKDDNPLLHAKNCIITPHTAWMSREARERILSITIQNINAFVSKNPIHVVSNQ